MKSPPPAREERAAGLLAAVTLDVLSCVTEHLGYPVAEKSDQEEEDGDREVEGPENDEERGDDTFHGTSRTQDHHDLGEDDEASIDPLCPRQGLVPVATVVDGVRYNDRGDDSED